MVEINREDYEKMKLAMKTKRFSVLKDLNLAAGVSELALRRVLKENAYAGISLEETFGSFKIVDGPTDFITQEEIDKLMNNGKGNKAKVKLNEAQYMIFKSTLYMIQINLTVNRPFAEEYEDVFVTHDLAMFFASTTGDGLIANTDEKRERNKKLYEYVLSGNMDIDEAIRMAIGDFEVV